MADRAFRNDVNVVFASSAAVHDGEHAYGWSKKAAEEELMAYATDWTILRFYNVSAGRRPNGGGLVDAVVKAARTGYLLEINGKGTAVRDYIHVFDVIDRIMFALDGRHPRETLEVGRGVGLSVN